MRHRTHKAKLATTTAKLVSLTSPVTIKASVPEGDKQGPATFDAVAYGGDKVAGTTLSRPIAGDYVIDLSGMSHAKNPKVNLDHKSNQRVGHLTHVDSTGNELKVAGVLSASTTYRDEVAKSAADGYPFEVSIEADLAKPEKVPAGTTVTVNGRQFSGPITVFRKSVLTDLGFVSHGASEGNHVKVAASAAGAKTMNEFEKFCASLGVDLENATEENKAALQKAFDMQKAVQAKANPEDAFNRTVADIANEERAKLDHEKRIRVIAKAAMQDHPVYIDQIETLARAALESRTDPDKFELELIRTLRSPAGRIRQEVANTQYDAEVIQAALCRASNLPNLEKHFSEQTLNAVDKCRLGNIGLQQLFLQIAHANGYHTTPGEKIGVNNMHAVLTAAFSTDNQARLGGGNTPFSLPNILGAVANKNILAGYMEEDPTWQEIAQVKSVSNFYTQNYFRLLDSLEYEEVGPGGEIKHGTLSEETYTSQLKTYGKMLGINRTQIINDDLGAFDDIRERLGRGAAKKFNTVFWTAFINNSSFYTSALTNYVSGSTTNLGTDGVGLGLVIQGFRQMTSPSADGSKHIGQDFEPTKILVPPELEGNAWLAYKNNNLGMVASSSGNIYAGRFRPVVQWRLSNSSFTGYSTTAYYLFGDGMRPMLVTFLNGNRTPTVESSEMTFNSLGIQFRAYHDFSCDKSEYLAGIKSKGAS